MKCEELRRHFSAYIDGEALPEVAAAIEAHVAQCEDCRRELEQYRAFAASFADIGDEELPFGFQAELKAGLDKADREAGKNSSRKTGRRTWLRVAALAASVVLVVGLGVAGLGALGWGRMGASAPQDNRPAAAYMSGSSAYDSAPMEPAPEPEEYMMEETPAGDGNYFADEGKAMVADTDAAVRSEEAVQRKIIKDYFLNIQVKDFQAAYDSIVSLANEYGGYVASGSTYNYDWSSPSGEMIIRVEAARADDAVAAISELGKVQDSSFSSDDITTEYYDTASRLAVLKAQRDRLLDMYDQAETVEDLIYIEGALTEVITKIEALEGTLKSYDQLTTLSMIHIFISTPASDTQVVELDGWAGFWQGVRENVIRGLNNTLDLAQRFVYFLLRALPVLVLIALVIWIIVACVKRRKKRRNK